MQVNLSKMPKPQQTYVVDFPRLDGGLNLKELSYRLDPNESPNMMNLWWQDGVLQCRDGQRFLNDAWQTPSTGFACTDRPFHGRMFYHVSVSGSGSDPDSSKLYWATLPVSPAISKRFEPFDPVAFTQKEIANVEPNRGSFFLYGGDLYYKNQGSFIRIVYDETHDTFAAYDATLPDLFTGGCAYTPTILINADPTNGSGTEYQPENRLCPCKRLTYNAQSGVTEYHLPVSGVEILEKISDVNCYCRVTVDGTRLTEGTQGSPADYWVDATNGVVYFTVAPPVTDPPTNNTVEIVYNKRNEDAGRAIMGCQYVTVLSVENAQYILMAGSPAQKNAVFWNGNDSAGLNPGYYPIPNYNLCGDASEAITGIGKQYDDLILFKESSIGKLEFEITQVDERDSILFKYQNINARVGCDLPWTIQLVENNLVFCNTHRGVHMLMSASAAYENNVVCISDKVNGERNYGLLYDVRRQDSFVPPGTTYYEETSLSTSKGTTDDFYDVTPVAGVSDVGSIKVANVTYYVNSTAARTQAVCAMDDDSRYWLCASGRVYVWDYSISPAKDPSWFFFANVHGTAYLLDNDGRLYHLDPWGRVTLFERSFVDYPIAERIGETEKWHYVGGIPIRKVYAFPAQYFGGYDRLKDVLSILLTIRSDTDTTIALRYDTDYETRADLTSVTSFSWRFTPRNLAHRCLLPARYARVQRRTPGCRHVQHFALTLENHGIFEDMSIVSMQIFYRYQGKER